MSKLLWMILVNKSPKLVYCTYIYIYIRYMKINESLGRDVDNASETEN